MPLQMVSKYSCFLGLFLKVWDMHIWNFMLSRLRKQIQTSKMHLSQMFPPNTLVIPGSRTSNAVHPDEHGFKFVGWTITRGGHDGEYRVEMCMCQCQLKINTRQLKCGPLLWAVDCWLIQKFKHVQAFAVSIELLTGLWVQFKWLVELWIKPQSGSHQFRFKPRFRAKHSHH